MLLPPLDKERTRDLGVLLDQAPFVNIERLRVFCASVCERLERVQEGTLISFEELLELQGDCHILQWFMVNAGLFVVTMPGIEAWYKLHGLPYPPDETKDVHEPL